MEGVQSTRSQTIWVVIGAPAETGTQGCMRHTPCRMLLACSAVQRQGIWLLSMVQLQSGGTGLTGVQSNLQCWW